jgi:hypothetical protein
MPIFIGLTILYLLMLATFKLGGFFKYEINAGDWWSEYGFHIFYMLEGVLPGIVIGYFARKKELICALLMAVIASLVVPFINFAPFDFFAVEQELDVEINVSGHLYQSFSFFISKGIYIVISSLLGRQIYLWSNKVV